MRALIVGAEGQLGRALTAAAPEGVMATAYGRAALDITDKSAVKAALEDIRPDFIFNAAAYTAVDKAESNEDDAYRINAEAVATLSQAAQAKQARLVQVSTDFVFDGRSGSPYTPDAPTHPLSAYGRTKRAGEEAAGDYALIVRTAWVYAPTGHNFVRTMLRLMGSHDRIRVVADQIGTPTYAPDFAAALWTLAAKGVRGMYHYTDSGAASWFDFAVAIQEEALARNLLSKPVPVIPITTAEYPTPAKRPSYSVLDKTKTFAALGGPAPHWRENLRVMLDELKRNG